MRGQLIGRRVLKTAVAVFITAFICDLIGWPPVFAVITAIVTIEPTVAQSIKKGIVRFPASAIGSGFAVILIYFFGNSPITYTLAALLTIIVCFRLKLHDGLLVATLTAVAMIEVIHSNLFYSFLIRLGTTTIGLSVSTLVNMFILPPDYSVKIKQKVDQLLSDTGEELAMVVQKMTDESLDKHTQEAINKRLHVAFYDTEKLVDLQLADLKYHRLDDLAVEKLELKETELFYIERIHYHIGNMMDTPFHELHWTQEEKARVNKMVVTLADFMKNPDEYKKEEYQNQALVLLDRFWESKRPSEDNRTKFFTPEIVILYELLSIFRLVEKILED